jgi:hypothetical protein
MGFNSAFKRLKIIFKHFQHNGNVSLGGKNTALCCSLLAVKGKVKFILEEATKAQKRSRGVALLFP